MVAATSTLPSRVTATRGSRFPAAPTRILAGAQTLPAPSAQTAVQEISPRRMWKIFFSAAKKRTGKDPRGNEVCWTSVRSQSSASRASLVALRTANPASTRSALRSLSSLKRPLVKSRTSLTTQRRGTTTPTPSQTTRVASMEAGAPTTKLMSTHLRLSGKELAWWAAKTPLARRAARSSAWKGECARALIGPTGCSWLLSVTRRTSPTTPVSTRSQTQHRRRCSLGQGLAGDGHERTGPFNEAHLIPPLPS